MGCALVHLISVSRLFQTIYKKHQLCVKEQKATQLAISLLMRH